MDYQTSKKISIMIEMDERQAKWLLEVVTDGVVNSVGLDNDPVRKAFHHTLSKALSEVK